jgi:hypothetical protein
MTPNFEDEIRQNINNLAQESKASLKTIQEMSTTLALLSSDMKRLAKTSEENLRTLRGANGDMGLVAKVDKLADELQDIETREATCGIVDLTRIVQGDGSNQRGLVERVRNLEQLPGQVEGIRSELYGRNDGQQTYPGMVERMRVMEERWKKIDKWAWALFIAISTDVALRLWPHIIQMLGNP